MTFRLVPKSVTLNDLERRSGRYFASFCVISAKSVAFEVQFVYNVVLKQLLGLPRFQNLLLTVYDHINTICAIIQRVFGQNKRSNSLDFRLQLPTLMSPGEFLVAMGASIVLRRGWTGEYTLKLGLMDR